MPLRAKYRKFTYFWIFWALVSSRLPIMGEIWHTKVNPWYTVPCQMLQPLISRVPWGAKNPTFGRILKCMQHSRMTQISDVEDAGSQLQNFPYPVLSKQCLHVNSKCVNNTASTTHTVPKKLTKQTIYKPWASPSRCTTVRMVVILTHPNWHSVVIGEQQIHRSRFSCTALRHKTGFLTSLWIFTSIDYWTVYKYDDTSKIYCKSITSTNQLTLLMFIIYKFPKFRENPSITY